MVDIGEFKVGTRTIVPATQRNSRITGLIWGSAGTGKTTLACTAPGRKLLVNFDPDGASSVAGFEDLDVLDFSDPDLSVVELFKRQDPLGLSSVLEHYDTIIFDSLTNIAFKTLMRGVAISKGASIERPDPQAYQVRNSLIIQLVKNVLAMTSKHNTNVFFIAHEDAPVMNDEGVVLHITLSLGGKLPEQTALDFSEVWCVQDMGVGRDRRIIFRPARNRKPMKTRMFDTSSEAEFSWQFDPDTQEGMTIASWYEQWKANGFRKIAVPKAKVKK